jgi:dihydrodipicolinate synthase/N-acetylneuraminate lyase
VTAPLLAGVLPVVQTPFTSEDAVDESVLTAEADWLFAQGADGLTFAMVSEILRLSEGERRRAVEVLCDAAAGRGPVVVSVCSESTRGAVELATHAASVGADAVMALPPLLVSLSPQKLAEHFRAIIRSTDLVTVIQDASGYVGHAIPVGVYGDLYAEFGDKVMFKPEAQPIGPRLSELLMATDGRARVFEGTGGAALMETFPRGLVGTMPGADLCWAIRALWDALSAGDVDRAYQISFPLGALIALQPSLDAFVAVEKHLLHRQGVFPNDLRRAPVGYELDEPGTAEINRLFTRLQQACGRQFDTAVPSRASGT